MATQTIMSITDETLDKYVTQAAKAADYEKGFGIRGCDLSKPIWWAAYCRQSLDQQTQNNRLPEYLLTLAKMARDSGVVVPREYVLYVMSEKSRLAVTLLSFFLGTLGVHRFYLSKIGTGILMLLTAGGLGVWALIDFIMAVSGVMKDKDGNSIKNW